MHSAYAFHGDYDKINKTHHYIYYCRFIFSLFLLFIVYFPCHVEFKREHRDTNEVLNFTCYLFKFIYARRVNMASIRIILLFVYISRRQITCKIGR